MEAPPTCIIHLHRCPDEVVQASAIVFFQVQPIDADVLEEPNHHLELLMDFKSFFVC